MKEIGHSGHGGSRCSIFLYVI